MNVSSVTLFLTRKNLLQVTLPNINFITYVYYVSKLQWLLCLKLHFFINNQNAGLHICLLLLSFIQYHSVILLFYVFTFKIFKILFMSKIWQYRCILSFLFSLHTIISEMLTKFFHSLKHISISFIVKIYKHQKS